MNNQQIDIAALAGVDIRKVNKEELVDVSGMSLDPSVPQELRAGYILKTTGNPYCFRVDDLGVKLDFTEAAPPLQDVLCGFFLRKKGGCHGTETPGGR